MRYEKALEIGRKRAWEAADVIQNWTGIRAMAVCTVRPDSTEGQWQPVGRLNWKEIARDDRFRRGGMYDLFIVDECGTVKACSRRRYPLADILRLAERIPVGVAMPGRGELWRRLEEERVRGVWPYFRGTFGEVEVEWVCRRSEELARYRRAWEMDRERLKEELRRHAMKVVEKVSADMPATLRRFGEVEKALKESTEELGKEWLQSWCDEAKDDSPTPQCPHCGGRMRQKERVKKEVICRGGDVAVKRKRWWCNRCGESFFPSG